MDKKVILMILDGWGIGNHEKSDVIYNTNTPVMDRLSKEYPFSKLITFGEKVGLPEGQMGNSEVGHLNIGAGRIVNQDLVRINNAIKDNSISDNKVILDALAYAKKEGKKVHFVGLLGEGGVHAISQHLFKLCDITKEQGLDDVFIHCLTDGRDTDPKSGKAYMKNLLDHLETSNGKVASVVGRYYGMDRDKKWERIKLSYDAMVKGKGSKTRDILGAIEESYLEGVTDEFIKPIISVDDQGKPIGLVEEGDVVVCYNYRTDRLRQLTTVLTQKDFPEHNLKTVPLHYVTMTKYDESFEGVNVIYDKEDLKMTLGEVVAKAGKSQLRIAETEKYAHVTFFFSGGREQEFDGEFRIMKQSPKVATYDLAPKMSAEGIRDAVMEVINESKADFICLNFANGDMVGHTGVWEAISEAVATVDSCTGEVLNACKQNGYSAIVIADHGNADYAINADGSPNTAHTTNLVPCILVDDSLKDVTLKDGVLADVAPTILKLMGVTQPPEMTGEALF